MAVALQQGHDKVVAVLLEHDSRSRVRLPALHIAAKKNDVKAATLLLKNKHDPDATSKVCSWGASLYQHQVVLLFEMLAKSHLS